MPNLRLDIAYDGTNYCGWQIQPNGPTIQAAVEAGIRKLTGETVSVLSAGRTDSGVHALGQVCNFHTSSVIPPKQFAAALQTCLPHDILCLSSQSVPDDFHATFSAKRKRYRYLIDNSPLQLPFLRHYACHIRRPLDAGAMHTAAQSLVGRHDFRSFETEWPNKATSVRTVFELSITRRAPWPLWSSRTVAESDQPENAGSPIDLTAEVARPWIVLEIEADGFLYNMVRTITGTLINVGRGKWTAADVARILASQSRPLAGATAPAHGLYLVRVQYD